MRDARRHACAALGVAMIGLLTAPAAPVAAQQGDTLSTLDGVYTAEQAERGKATYMRVCSECHALDYYQGTTLRAWEGAPLFDLFDVIITRMPENNPGSLRRRDYVDMMAYILELNGMPPGEQPLPSRASALRQIFFRWRSVS